MQDQAAVDGGDSATDGYSPAGEAPPPATRLVDLPPALLDDIICRDIQDRANSQLPLTCRAFSLAGLLHVPTLCIQLGRQCCDQLFTPRVVAALQARKSKLTLTLWQPEKDESMYYNKHFAPTLQLPQTEYTQDYNDLLAHALAKLDNCAAVEVCNLASSGEYSPSRFRHLRCPPGLAQQLLDSFPSLTALTLEGFCVSSDALASMLSHPPLALQLQQLHLTKIDLEGDGPRGVGTLLQGLQLKQLSIAVKHHRQPSVPPLPSLQHLAQHLTQLHLKSWSRDVHPSFFREYLQPLAQLQVLTISNQGELDGLMEVLQVLPQLHTLQLPDVSVSGQQQLDVLLAATQITSLQLDTVKALDTSYADAPCSWQRLELTGDITWSTIAYLPLHSLSQPLVLWKLDIGVEDIPDPEVAAALHSLAAIKVPVQVEEVQLTMLKKEQQSLVFEEHYTEERRGPNIITPALLQQQRVDLAQLVALLQPLQCCGKVVVFYLLDVTAADVAALAPLCRDCTHFKLWNGSLDPSLEFWRQLVQLMPDVQVVTFEYTKRCVSAAMHESLQLMAAQPWTRWLQVTIILAYCDSQLPSCWQAGSWWKAGNIKVSVFNGW